MNRIGPIAEKLLLEVPEVKSVGRRTGRAELDEHAEGVHYSEIDVDLKDRRRRKEESSLISAPACRYCRPRSTSASPSPTGWIICYPASAPRSSLKIFGEDLDMLRRLADSIRGRLKQTPGLVDLQVEKQVPIPQLQIRVDYTRAALYGLTPAAITETLETLSNGRMVSQIVDGNRRFDVVHAAAGIRIARRRAWATADARAAYRLCAR